MITCFGVTSGMDGALHLIKRYNGDKIAAMLSRAIQYTPRGREDWPVAPNVMKFDSNWKKNKVYLSYKFTSLLKIWKL